MMRAARGHRRRQVRRNGCPAREHAAGASSCGAVMLQHCPARSRSRIGLCASASIREFWLVQGVSEIAPLA